MKHALPLALTCLMLGACSYTKTTLPNDQEAARYDPATSARVRIFTSPEFIGSYQPGQSCAQLNTHAANRGLIDTTVYKHQESYMLWRTVDLRGMQPENYQNNVIGMPPSQATQRLQTDRLSYSEFVLPAGKPSVVQVRYSAPDGSCDAPPVMFEPQAGKDYEVSMQFSKDGFIATARCQVNVVALGGEAAVKQSAPVATKPCR
ncbi:MULTISPECIES: hypothetical protein [unclassified Pseudomonas]|uniref:hypothetical protein n=1 Tax=unclassified Pseudomonas TaxID=196821 RepID=UPI0015A4BF6B|nr:MULTISPECIES: hypothetical protein [unclassified Pseudomonas]NWC95332.1 hypothetical protein [Pseudomonas sp. IPO3779]NWD16114.1 hypothetical protein [Pseudomonas sp. IPO3778]